jgi:hypothetical protein
MSPFAIVAFFVVLIGLGTLSFRYFERPAQRIIRSFRSPKLSLAQNASMAAPGLNPAAEPATQPRASASEGSLSDNRVVDEISHRSDAR